MKKPKSSTSSRSRNAVARNLAPLVEQVRRLVQSARSAAAASVNTLQVHTNFEIGQIIVQHEQQGSVRAEYGRQLLNGLAERLTSEFGRGFSRSNLQNMRTFFLLYQDRMPQIRQKPSGKLPTTTIGQRASDQLPAGIAQKPSAKLSTAPSATFNLSWSHYVLLLTIKDARERSFYEIESAQSGWSVPKLKRQLNSALYERLTLSRDKKRVRKLAEEGHTVTQPSDMLKDPYILEFLGLEEKPAYTESDLESAIIGKLQHFLLELGKGFLFEARQKRFTFDEDHFFVDLVFYNRLLRCYVLVDLKLDKLTLQDLGQMQMSVNFFDRFLKTPGENPTVGILLCNRKKTAIIELTLPKNANVFASQYQLYLPSKEDLKQRLIEWTEEISDDS
jgi:predicted nuclease of restriction endonuclease-like (RecB) superfamily